LTKAVPPPLNPPTMSTVHLAFSPDPAYVRTIRLVAAAVARRAGVADELLDEVRLAIGEACSRAVAMHRRHRLVDLIDVAMSDGGRFVVRVTDRGPADSAHTDPGETTGAIMAQVVVETGRVPVDEDALTAGVGIALLNGLVQDLSVAPTRDGTGTEVRMSWPVQRR
jgi:anti-sigma regulatory factor (Ser/Thr protein kinase)